MTGEKIGNALILNNLIIMKKTILLLTISIMAISCSKDNSVPDAGNDQKLVV